MSDPNLSAPTVRAARREVGPAVALGVFAAGAALFVRISDDMVEGETHAFDRHVLTLLRQAGDLSKPVGPTWLQTAATDVTSLGSLTDLGLIVLAAAGFFLSLRRFRESATLLLAAGGGLLLSQLFKTWFGRARPDAIFNLVPVVNASFPSGHAMLSAVVFLTLGALIARFVQRRRVKVYALGVGVAATLLVGASRVYLGAHWPTDVLAGWSLGAAWATLCWLGEWAWDRRAGRAAQPVEDT
jgi:undecaprenyl-diphosphatase